MTQKVGGLAGVSAGQTAICTVGKEGLGLTYRGYSIHDLAEHSCFEEVAYLLIYGQLPTQIQLASYKQKLLTHRTLPDSLKKVLQLIPAHAHPMDVLRTACSFLGTQEPESEFSQQYDVADRLLAIFPSVLTYWYHFSKQGIEIDTAVSEQETIAGHFLTMLHQKAPLEIFKRAVDVSLILYAEHEFNASTFAARVTAATLSDFYSSVTSAIGALRGPLHGGANEAAMELISKFTSPVEAERGLKDMLERKDLIMGFGHRVYKISDPRSDIIKKWSKQLAEVNHDQTLYPVLLIIRIADSCVLNSILSISSKR